MAAARRPSSFLPLAAAAGIGAVAMVELLSLEAAPSSNTLLRVHRAHDEGISIIRAVEPAPGPNVEALRANNEPADQGTAISAKVFHPPCNFTVGHLNSTCPRFVRIQPTTEAGMGDRFMQFLVPYVFALEADAVPFPIEDRLFHDEGSHGTYNWTMDFFNFNARLPFSNASTTLAAFPGLDVVNLTTTGDYATHIDSVKDRCNVIIEVDMNACDTNCYLASKPSFQRVRHVLACNVLHSKGRARLPPLEYDRAQEEYVVAIHLRRGDIFLHAGEIDGQAYFNQLKAQIDCVLQDFPMVHYYFITEGPELNDDEPPFPFLGSIFPRDDDRIKTSYLNHLDSEASLLHMMNADMLVTTGSSFPYIAVTVSPKPVVVFGRPKEGYFFPSYLRDDFVLLDNDGSIISPTLGEVSARIAIRYEEVHGRLFPYRRRHLQKEEVRFVGDSVGSSSIPAEFLRFDDSITVGATT